MFSFSFLEVGDEVTGQGSILSFSDFFSPTGTSPSPSVSVSVSLSSPDHTILLTYPSHTVPIRSFPIGPSWELVWDVSAAGRGSGFCTFNP